jgi:hypothetical protein
MTHKNDKLHLINNDLVIMLDNIDEEWFSKKINSWVMRLDCRNISASLLNSTQRNAKQDIPWEQKPLYDDV